MSGFVASCKSEPSLVLQFPSTETQQTIKRVTIGFYAPNSLGGAGGTGCDGFLGLAADGSAPNATAVKQVAFKYPFEQTADAPGIPEGPQLVYVVAYADESDDVAIVEGCRAGFDVGTSAQNMPVALQLVFPETARLEPVRGNLVLGRPGEALSSPFQVRVVANAPVGARAVYSIPGVALNFASSLPGLQFLGPNGSLSDSLTVLSDTNGLVRVGVRLPEEVGGGEVTASSPALESLSTNQQHTLRFSITIPPPSRFTVSEPFSIPDIGRPQDLAIGTIVGGRTADAVVLGCRGTEETCVTGRQAKAPFGQSALAVVKEVGTTPALAPVILPPEGLGILPAALAVVDLLVESGAEVPEIAVVNSRRADCQNRVCPEGEPCPCFRPLGPQRRCPCETSEVVVLKRMGAGLSFDNRYPMTGKNAVALAAFEFDTRAGRRSGLAVAAQGRSKAPQNQRPCSSSPRCLSILDDFCSDTPEKCGCPPGEKCENKSCEARDTMLDFLAVDPSDEILKNREGCQETRTYACQGPGSKQPCKEIDPNDVAIHTCLACTDNPRDTALDGCGRCVPDSVRIGTGDTVAIPEGVAAGTLSGRAGTDFFVATQVGFGFVRKQGDFYWRWDRSQPLVNAQIDGAVVADVDSIVDLHPDLVWYSRSPCSAGAFDTCPVVGMVSDGQSKGCLGVYYTNAAPSLVAVNSPDLGGCARYQLPFEPHDLCVGFLNNDATFDVALAPKDLGAVAVHYGDGRGGLLYPAENIALPGGAVSGPMACGDVTGDGTDDLVTIDPHTARLFVLSQHR